MRLVTYEANKKWRAGIIVDDHVVDSTAAAIAAEINVRTDWISNRQIIRWRPDQLSQLERAALDLAAAHSSDFDVFPIANTRLGPPITDPDKIICLGLNYRSHAEEAGFPIPAIPILFSKYRNALTGPTSPIVLPRMSEQIDYEGELAVVIGKRCKDISIEEALNYVAGYMVFNDVSARDLQMRTSQWLSGKSLDTFAPCGPVLVVNEIPDPQNLNIWTRINDETLQEGNTKDMIFSVADTLSYISQLMTLEPGDIIATGTPKGVGFTRNPPVFLRAGDIVEVEIEWIGTLRNPVVRNG